MKRILLSLLFGSIMLYGGALPVGLKVKSNITSATAKVAQFTVHVPLDIDQVSEGLKTTSANQEFTTNGKQYVSCTLFAIYPSKEPHFTKQKLAPAGNYTATLNFSGIAEIAAGALKKYECTIMYGVKESSYLYPANFWLSYLDWEAGNTINYSRQGDLD